jgi:hypothetical protein
MAGYFVSIFLLQINPGSELGGESLIPGIPNHYISASYARLVMELAGRVRTVAFISAAVILVASIAVNSSGFLVKDLNIKEVLRNALITVLLLVIWAPSFGVLMGFGYRLGELLVAENEVTKMLLNTFRLNPDTDTAGQRAGEGPGDGGAGDVKSGGWLSWILDIGVMGERLRAAGMSMLIAGLCAILFTIASFVMPSVWLVFATLLFVFGPLVISFGMIPRIGGKILGNLFGSLFELSLWQAWFHICAWLVIASNDLVRNKATDIFIDGAEGAQAVDSAYTSAESAAMGLIFAGLYFATPLVVRHLVPVSQFGTAAAAIINKASSYAAMGAGAVTGGVKGAMLGAAKTIGGKAVGMAAGGFGGGGGNVGGGGSGSAGGARGGYQIMKGGRSANPAPARVAKPGGAGVTQPGGAGVTKPVGAGVTKPVSPGVTKPVG